MPGHTTQAPRLSTPIARIPIRAGRSQTAQLEVSRGFRKHAGAPQSRHIELDRVGLQLARIEAAHAAQVGAQHLAVAVHGYVAGAAQFQINLFSVARVKRHAAHAAKARHHVAVLAGEVDRAGAIEWSAFRRSGPR